MFGLSDSQLQNLMMSAGDIPQEKRGLFLQRVDAMLTLKGPAIHRPGLG